jgi:hypothetical protein
MAALNRPRGFEVKGATLRSNLYIASGVIFPGDMVIFDGANPGQVRASPGGAAEQLLGVCLGKVNLDYPGSVAIGAGDECLVCDHPMQLYVTQAVAGQISDATSPLKYAQVSNAVAGSTQFNQSRQQLSAIATTATLPLRISQTDTNVFNNPADATSPVQVVVAINTPAFN